MQLDDLNKCASQCFFGLEISVNCDVWISTEVLSNTVWEKGGEKPGRTILEITYRNYSSYQNYSTGQQYPWSVQCENIAAQS